MKGILDLDEINNLFRKYKVVRAYIFGSYAKGTFTEESDLDFVIVPDRGLGYDFYELWDKLEALTGKDVDLVTECGIKHSPDKGFAERVFAERVCIYDRQRDFEEVR